MDGHRFREAFLNLMAESTQWPAPKAFMDAMPKRPELKALPPKPVDQAKVQALLDELAEAFQIPR